MYLVMDTISDGGSEGSVAGGDINGAGFSDLFRLYFGDVYLYYGSSSSSLSSSYNARLTGGSYFAGRVEALGDVSGDGYGDLVMTDHQKTVYDSFQGNMLGAGSLGVFFGSYFGVTNGQSMTQAAVTLNGVAPFDYFAFGVDGAGDVNGDGHGDLLVSNRGTGADRDPRLFYGPLMPGTYNATNADATFPSSAYEYQHVAPAGDNNGDGVDDILIGHIVDASGGVFLFQGAN